MLLKMIVGFWRLEKYFVVNVFGFVDNLVDMSLRRVKDVMIFVDFVSDETLLMIGVVV